MKQILLIITLLLSTVLTVFAQPSWEISGAPIGDDSAFDYPAGGWTPTTLLSISGGGDEVSVYDFTGAPDGVHLYRVDAFPNVVCGAGAGQSPYFGVFVVNGSSPNYSLSYKTTLPTCSVGNIPDADLAERTMNSDVTCNAWSAMGATLDVPGDSLYTNGISNRREVMLIPPTCILPVEFLATAADCEEELGASSIVKVQWVTTNELDNKHFVIERSDEGEHFRPIGQVEASDSKGSQRNYYSFIDEEQTIGNTYYRIRQVDFDGNGMYSSIFDVRCTQRAGLDLTVFPNPTKDLCHVTTEGLPSSNAEIKVFDVLGHLVFSRSAEVRNRTISEKIDLRDFAAGMYFLTVSSGAITKTAKFQVLR